MNYKLTSTQQTFNTELVTRDIPVWNNVLYVLFDCEIEYEGFSKVLNEIFMENSLFRTTFFKNEDGQIEQAINEYVPQEFEELSFSSKNDLDTFAKKEANIPTLLCDNPLKTYIINLDGKYGCLFRIHHILFDGICESIIIDKIKSKLGIIEEDNNAYSYEKILSDHSYENSPRYNRSIKYWNKQLEKSYASSIYSFNSSDNYTATEAWFDFDREIIDAVKDICQRANLPFSAFTYALFAVYVNKTIGLTDFSVGMPILNRMTNEEMHTLGLFMHILPLIIHIENSSTFISVIEDIYDEILELTKHQRFTIYDIKKNCTFDETKQFFDVVVNYFPKVDSPDCFQKSFRSDFSTTPLEFRFHEDLDGNVCMQALYRKAYFQNKDIEDIFAQFGSIVKAFVDNPDIQIKDIHTKSSYNTNSSSLDLIVKSFNDTTHNYDIEASLNIYSLFEKTAKENADDICLKADGRSITFGELLDASTSLDCAIKNRLENKSIIAIIAERSMEMYTAIYGIIRGGNAYLPIDPSYPQDRIDYILKNSGAQLVVAQGKYCHLVGATPCIDMTDFLEDTPVFDNVPPCNVDEDDTAYVIYTSGSTGQPKGAKISHKSAINRIAWMHDFYPLEKGDVILQKTPYTFDVSVWEMFWWGMFGGQLVASKPNEHFIPEKILEEVYNNKVTHLHFVPSVFDVFLSYLEKHSDQVKKFASVKHVLLSGEALTAILVNRFYSLYSYDNVKLHNLYGPTECAVDVTYYDCTSDEQDPVPIGKPIYNTQMYVLDENMKQLPIGVTGELHIGGVNVGQGYLNNEKLTNERFVDNPFGEGKLYKTGDLAYWQEDGNIVYVGRNDFQVKIRGLRIELGEIENAINEIDGVDQSAVVAKKDNDGRQIVCAFYTGKELSTNDIKNSISSKLPQYMIPNSFNHIDEMPLTSSGKTDRNTLMKLDVDIITQVDNSRCMPRTEQEKHICSLFSDILSVDNVNLESDFYELGGNSLEVIKLLSYDEFEKIKVADFMACPTPSGLIKLLNEDSISEYDYLNTLYLPDRASKAIVLFPFAGGNASSYMALVNEFKNNNSAIALFCVEWVENESNYGIIANEIEDLSSRYDVYFYSHCAGSVMAFKLLDLLPKDCVKKYIAGASLPEKSYLPFSIWSLFSDKAIINYLGRAGFKSDMIDDFVLDKMISQFRVNTKEYQGYFNSKSSLTNTKTYSIVSKDDPFTKKHAKADILWNKLVSSYEKTIFINSKSHYFQKDNPSQLLEIILSCIKEDE